MGPVECDERFNLLLDLSARLELQRRDAMGKAAKSAAIAAREVAASDGAAPTDDDAAPTNGTAPSGGTAPTSAAAAAAESDEEAVAELNERAEELVAIGRHLDLYTRHLLRKALSHSITPAMLEQLKSNPARIHFIADYKQKVLPGRHRESQTEAFGKRGKSLHGMTCLRWDPDQADYKVLNVRCACDDANQTWFHTLSAIRTSLDVVMGTWPDCNVASLQTDGAGNYDCTAFMSSVHCVFKATGLRLVRHLVTEVGDGKNLVRLFSYSLTLSLSLSFVHAHAQPLSLPLSLSLSVDES